MKRHHAIAALLACAAVAVGCGDGESESEAEPAVKQVSLAQREAQVEKNPYDLRCADIRDKVASARMTRIAQYALADDAQIPRLNRLQASQSIFYAITELCKSKPGSYQPATDAIAAVRSGEYRADLGAP
jgi:hypothetical protein